MDGDGAATKACGHHHGGGPTATAAAPGECACCARGAPATQSLDELAFSRSACAAAAAGSVGKLRAILQRSPDAVASDGAAGTSGYTPLHYAARAGAIECAELLLSAGAAVDARTAAGRAAPLHRAAHVGHVGIVSLLLRHGADAFAQDADGETPLHKAAAAGHTAAAEALLAFVQAQRSTGDGDGDGSSNISGGGAAALAALRDRKGRTAEERAAGTAAATAVAWPRGGGG